MEMMRYSWYAARTYAKSLPSQEAAANAIPGGVSDLVLQVYDPATDTWSTLDDMTTAPDWVAAAAIDKKIYVVGGGVLEVTL